MVAYNFNASIWKVEACRYLMSSRPDLSMALVLVPEQLRLYREIMFQKGEKTLTIFIFP